MTLVSADPQRRGFGQPAVVIFLFDFQTHETNSGNVRSPAVPMSGHEPIWEPRRGRR